MRVAVHYHRSEADALALTASLNRLRPDSARAIQTDLTDCARIRPLVETVHAFWGRLDVLVNNASSFYATPLEAVSERSFNDLVGTNLKAPLFLIQAAAPFLRIQGGSIVNLIDIHAKRPLRGYLVYGSAKAGLEMLTRALARELAPDIRVNGIAPGSILWQESDLPDALKRQILKRTPLGRLGTPDDIARTVLFLVRDAPYVTGAILPVDGGRSIGW
ncbi:pteridine reductase [mine drainage metagenome]|uniref:Pteridine reductase n=2 Tax=mine drainage metagenome TaxID=410659 RepID=T1BUP6_9ZZZZ